MSKWKFRAGRNVHAIVANGELVAEFVEASDAERAIACRNACDGIEDPSVVLEMLEVLRDALILLSSPETVDDAIGNIEAAIARAEGRKE